MLTAGGADLPFPVLGMVIAVIGILVDRTRVPLPDDLPDVDRAAAAFGGCRRPRC